MTTEFKEDMKVQLEEYHRSCGRSVEKNKERHKNLTGYECEASGIDMVVSRIVNGRCTKKLCIYLSQQDEEGRGIMFLKNMNGGAVEDATVEKIAAFFKDVQGTIRTGSNLIPVITKGKEFARTLMQMKEKELIALAKEGLINTELIGKNSYRPWYAKECPWVEGDLFIRSRTIGHGVQDKHGKLIRYALEQLANRYDEDYSTMLSNACSYNVCHDKCRSIWAFSMLADIFDEPFAQKCFDEYLDNDRLDDLSASGIYNFFEKIVEVPTHDWEQIVNSYRSGNTTVSFEKTRFWEFIQQSVGVGLGRKLSKYLDLYQDYLHMAYSCDGKVREKYPQYIQIAHDIYSEKCYVMEEFQESERLAEFTSVGCGHIDHESNGYQLRTLRTVKEFVDEAQQNCNCVASYVDRVASGRCWVASFRPIGSPETLLTVEVSPEGKMIQVKGKYNREPTEGEMKMLVPFQTHILESMAVPMPMIQGA